MTDPWNEGIAPRPPVGAITQPSVESAERAVPLTYPPDSPVPVSRARSRCVLARVAYLAGAAGAPGAAGAAPGAGVPATPVETFSIEPNTSRPSELRKP